MHNRRMIFGFFFSHAFQKLQKKKKIWDWFEDSRSAERRRHTHTHTHNDDRCGFRWVTAADGTESSMNRADILYSHVCVTRGN